MEEGEARGGKIVSGLLGQERQEGKVGRKILLPLFLFLVVSLIGVEEEEEKMMEPIFFLCFPPYVNLENHVRKRRNIAGRGNKRRSSALRIFLCPEGYGKREEEEGRKTAEAPFCHKAAKRGGQKPAPPPPLLSLCRTKSGGHCLAEVDDDDGDRRVVKCSSDGRREIIKCPVRKGRKPLLYLLSDSEPKPPIPHRWQLFREAPFRCFWRQRPFPFAL